MFICQEYLNGHLFMLWAASYKKRWGVLKSTTRAKLVVIPTEIQNLKDLEAYIKLPGTYPITKFKMDYQHFHKNTSLK
jgi:type IV secretory pathway TraG/TraD family ATPase VirD4